MGRSYFDNEDSLDSIDKVSEVDIVNEFGLSINDEYGMTIADEKKAKDALASMRKAASLRLDGRKLKQASVLMDTIESNIDTMNDKNVQDRVRDNIETAMDLKFLAEATEKSMKMLQQLMRIDSIDGHGTSARIAVAIDLGDGWNFVK